MLDEFQSQKIIFFHFLMKIPLKHKGNMFNPKIQLSNVFTEFESSTSFDLTIKIFWELYV